MSDSIELLALALRNFGPWLYTDVDADAALEELVCLNTTRRTIVLFRIAEGDVRVVAKPHFFSGEEMAAGRLPIPFRAHLYRDLLQEVSRGEPGCTLLGIELEDGHFPSERSPIFSFQKPLGSNNILLPDVDFLVHDFYEGGDFEDTVPFASKANRAVFAGSTTGLFINRQVLDLGLSWRIRSALYFKDHPQVDFRLHNIVMCESPEIEEELRSMGLGGAGATWSEQFGFKYLLSMDGNGATCSRVALALKSHCALMKYDSIHQLFYFPYLQPWLHYVPVAGDRDVERMLVLANAMPDLFAGVGQIGRDFFQHFLRRPQIIAYTRLILSMYRQSGPWFTPAHLARAENTERCAVMS